MVGQAGNRSCGCHGVAVSGAGSAIAPVARFQRAKDGDYLSWVPRCLPFLLRFIAILLFLAASSNAQAADQPTVGMVTKVHNDAKVVSSGGTTTAAVGTVVHMQDELRTGADARLLVTFRDQTTLTLGENAQVVIDRYVFDPDAGVGEAALNASKGAFRFATGRIKNLSKKQVTVSTPLAQLGIRGTDVWSNGHSVLSVIPTIDVSTQGGTVTLNLESQGTHILSAAQPPTPPKIWTAAQIAEALGQTSFGAGPGQQGPDRRGENEPDSETQQTTGDQQYAVNGGPATLAAALGATALYATVMTTTQQNNDRPLRVIAQPASP